MKKQTKQVKRTNKKHESGRSMIEMVGVLAVMGLITAAAFVLISSAMRSQKISRADDDVSAIAAGVRLLYNNSAATTGFKGIGTVEDRTPGIDTLEALGFKNVKPIYGSDDNYKLYEDSCDNGNCKEFVISFDAGDKDTCASLASRKWANGGRPTCDSTVVSIKFGYENQ